jgi:DNA repair exonuclease SbcCD ATPase subunit
MKKIIYTNLKIQNFLSVGNDVIEIDFQKGLNQIDGKNSDIPDRKNGVGKTVIANAHFFALFGETINKIKSEFVRNNVTNKDGIIILNFDVETSQGTNSYTIKRYVKKASKVELFQGDADITKSSIKETDKYICDLLSTNAAIHRCCDIMTVRDTIPFMEMEAKDKRTFIESIFDIDVFGIMLKDLKKMISETKKDKDVSSAKVSEIEKSLKSLIDQKEVIRKQIEERDEVLQNRKNDLITEIESIQLEIQSIPIGDVSKLENNISKIDNAIQDIDQKLSDIQIGMSHTGFQIDAWNDNIKKLSNINEGVKCDKCFQNIEHSHIENLEKEKEDLLLIVERYQNGLDDSKKEYDKFKTQKSKLLSKSKEIQTNLNKVKEDLLKIKNLNKNLELLARSLIELEDDMTSTSLSLDSFDDNIKKTVDRNTEESATLSELHQKLSDYDICKFILGEEGVKSFVVKKLLDLLNNTIEKYLVELGLNVRVKFDEYFEEIITSDGKIFSYKNASGAEKKSLDFACAFSFSDMRRKINQVSSNVEFYDEIFDTGTDSVGIELILKVLRERIDKNDICAYVVSHRKEIKEKIDGEIIMLEKSGKITRRIID